MPALFPRWTNTAARATLIAALCALVGVPAVFIAAYVVKSLPLVAMRWIVVGIVTYVAVAMLLASLQPPAPLQDRPES